MRLPLPILFVLACSLLLPGRMFAEQAGKAKLSVKEAVYDFGVVSQGAKVKHDFKVRNEGDAELVIQRLVAACGCTAASSTSQAIAPGEEASIQVEFDTSGFSGEKLKTVRVYTNDSDNPAQLLTVKGNISPEVEITPRSLFFDRVLKGSPVEESEKEFSVKVRDGSKASITNIKAFSKYLLIKELETSPKQRRLLVGISPEAPLGELRDRLVLSLSGVSQAGERSINVPVFAVVKGFLELKPAQLSFGVIDGKNELEREVSLDNLGKTPVQIKQVKSNNSAVNANFQVLEAGKRYIIKVSVDPHKLTRDLKTSVDILTDSDMEGTISLNVYGILPPKG